MSAAGHDGRGDESARGNAPKPTQSRGGTAPLIILALIVLALVIAGAASNDDVTCPGGASSCGAP